MCELLSGTKKNIILNKSLSGKCQFNNNESVETAWRELNACGYLQFAAACLVTN